MATKPLSMLAMLVLSSLAEAPRHGYALKRDVRDRSGGEVTPGATSLYRTVWQLLEEQLIVDDDERPASHLDDERRRYYRITPSGRRVLKVEVARLERLVAAVRPRRLALKPRP